MQTKQEARQTRGSKVAKKTADPLEKTTTLVKKASKMAKNPKEKSVHKIRNNIELASGWFVVSMILGGHSHHHCSSLASILVV